MKNRRTAVCWALAALLFTGCVAADKDGMITVAETTTAAQETSVTTAAETTADTTAAETAADTAVTSDTDTSAETVTEKTGKPVYSEQPEEETTLLADDGTLLFKGTFHTFTIDNESEYPGLAEALSGYTQVRRDAYDYQCSEQKTMANTHYTEAPSFFTDEYSMYYSCNVDNHIERCDDKVFSFINSEDGFSGGAHGWYITAGVNYDSQTGKELTVSDICTDIPRLVDILGEKLEKEYGDRVDWVYNGKGEGEEVTTDDYRALLRKTYGDDLMGYDDTWEDGEVYHMNGMNFVFVQDGVMFFSNQYDLASYASGTHQLTVLFSEAEGLFNEKYISSGEDFIVKNDFYTNMYLDFDGDGNGDLLSTDFEYDDDWNITGCKLTVGDKAYNFDYTPDNDSERYTEIERKEGKCTYRFYENGKVIFEQEI